MIKAACVFNGEETKKYELNKDGVENLDCNGYCVLVEYQDGRKVTIYSQFIEIHHQLPNTDKVLDEINSVEF